MHLFLTVKSVVKNVKTQNRAVKKKFLFTLDSVSYLFIFPGIVTIFYINSIFGRLKFKLRSINYGDLHSCIMKNMEKEGSIIESIADIGIEREEDLYV